jgi:hypothetical protein
MPLAMVASKKEKKDRAKVLKSRKISLAADLGGWSRKLMNSILQLNHK